MSNLRVFAQVNLENIIHNFREIKRITPFSDVLCVIKADAYGHGSLAVSKALLQNGAKYFAVATCAEALELRENGIATPILLLGYFDTENIHNIVENDITVSVFDIATAKLLSDTCKKLSKNLKIHIKVDVGMSRLGFNDFKDNLFVNNVMCIASMPYLIIEGIFTHFPASDDPLMKEDTQKQFEKFVDICTRIEQTTISIPIKHCANSGAILQYESMHLDMVRSGLLLYGYPPFKTKQLNLLPAMTLKSRVAQIKWVDKDFCVSYGMKCKLRRRSRVAVITIGYADGFMRSCYKGAYVLIGGYPAPIVGRICMDMCMADVTDITSEIKPNDEVVLWGHHENAMDAEDIANICGTISYEVMCAVSKRVPRIYI